jgi:hypothetical protein
MTIFYREARPATTIGNDVSWLVEGEGWMQWRMMVELSGADGSVRTHEVHVGGCLPAACSAETLGLTLAQAKQLLAELQRHLVQAQTEEYCRSRRRCPRCGAQRPLKDRRPRQLRSLFGVVAVRAPRFAPCRCRVGQRQILSPVGEIMPDRCTPDYERTLAEMGARLPYRRARALLDDLFPLGMPPVVETLRQRPLRVGARLECQAAAPSRSTPAVAASSITLSIDTGHIRAVPTYQVRTFEIIVAQASNDNGKQLVFASVPDEAYHQAQQLRGVLLELGATQATPVIILSDGAVGPRAAGEAASLGPTHHTLDWFHLAMRIHHVAQAVKGWPDETAENRAEAARLADVVEAHIRWRLWHGQVQRALDLIGETLGPLEAMANDAAAPAALQAGKVAKVLRGLETYVSGQAEIIIDYAKARRCGEPISTATTESTVQWLLHRRMSARQQMRWSPCGAHLMLKVRIAVMNGTFVRDHAAAEWRAKRPYHRRAA